MTACLGIGLCTSCTPETPTAPQDYTQYVNTFIGAADNGHTFPGACLPFGLIQASPETNAIGWQYCSGYNYQDSLIWGFSQTHLNGTGCMDLGDLLVMPVTGQRVRDDYKSGFSKKTESATPGYYTVELDKYKVKAELTATDHVALHRYTYQNADSASLLLDLQHGLVWNPQQYKSHVKACEINWEDAQTLTGHVRSSVWVNQDLYFVMKFNKPVTDSIYLPMEETEKGKRLIMSFDMKPDEQLLMKVAISTVGVDGAHKNMEKELADWDFDGTRQKAKDSWNSYLSRIEVTGTPDELENFYTSFYHALIQPNNIADVDGRYRNAKDSIVKSSSGVYYSTFSIWDTYRAAHPFYTLAVPERVDGFINSMIEQNQAQGYLPVWTLWGKETNTMIGNHSVWNPQQYKSHVKACEINWEDAQTLTGHVRSSVWVNQDLYFVMKFNKPVTDSIYLPMEETEKGKRLIMSFDMKPDEQLLMKVAISTVGVDGAHKNMEKELADWDFDGTRQKAKDSWNSYLSRIEVTGTPDELENFYTSFYHALIQPNNIADVDGRYRNAKDSIVKSSSGVYYSTFSIWDTYRAAHPFYTLAVPERVDGFINSMIEQNQAQGYLPVWTLWGKETNTMIGNHSVSVIAEAYKKGFRGFDAEKAFDAIKQTLTVSHPKSDWETYMKYGYYPTDKVDAESVSRTLESVYDDYAAATMAGLMGKKEDAEYFGKRSEFYKNLFDKETQFMRPRYADGRWKTPFNPSDLAHAESRGGDYTEGNAWQYTWHVQHDVPGLIELFGGKEVFLNKLDSLFTIELKGSGLADVTGLIGQYAHGNEPSHHVTFLYALAGKPERTQELIREIFDTQYKNKPDGLCGNDDCGQMSAWYMFNAMGFYPVDPVSGHYVFGAPQMPKIVLHLPDGKTFTVIAENLSKEHKYIDSITLNGEPYTKNYISHEDIVKGGTLVYKMK